MHYDMQAPLKWLQIGMSVGQTEMPTLCNETPCMMHVIKGGAENCFMAPACTNSV